MAKRAARNSFSSLPVAELTMASRRNDLYHPWTGSLALGKRLSRNRSRTFFIYLRGIGINESVCQLSEPWGTTLANIGVFRLRGARSFVSSR